MLRAMKDNNLSACFGYPVLLSNGMDAVKSLTLWMLALVNGMDAVSYNRLMNLTACFGYPILLSNEMDAVNSLTPTDASSCHWHGCCEFA